MRDYSSKQEDLYKQQQLDGRIVQFSLKAQNPMISDAEIMEEGATIVPLIQAMGDDQTAKLTVLKETARTSRRDANEKRIEMHIAANPHIPVSQLFSQNAAEFTAGFESGEKRSHAIGYDSTGGTSYGKFQISSKTGTMGTFIHWLERQNDAGSQQAAKELKVAGDANTGSIKGTMPDVWRKLVREGLLTDELQERFIHETHVAPALERQHPDCIAAVESNSTLGKAIFSTAVQHGSVAAEKMFTSAWEKSEGKTKKFLQELYADRGTRFSSSDEKIRSGAMKRLQTEQRILLADSGQIVSDVPHSYMDGGQKQADIPEKYFTLMFHRPDELHAFQKKMLKVQEKALLNNTFSKIVDLPPKQAVSLLSSAEGQRSLGILPHQASEVLGMYKTHFEHKKGLRRSSAKNMSLEL